jgi:hypothetical protein
MYCVSCGKQLGPEAFRCDACGLPVSSGPPASPAPGPLGMPAQGPVNVSTYLAQSILVTLFCCIPFGIVAIVYAAQVSGRVASGDVQGATAASASARTWCWVSFGFGLLGAVGYGIVLLIGLAAG